MLIGLGFLAIPAVSLAFGNWMFAIVTGLFTTMYWSTLGEVIARRLRHGPASLRVPWPLMTGEKLEAVLILERTRSLERLHVEVRGVTEEGWTSAPIVASAVVPVPKLPRGTRTRHEIPLRLEIPSAGLKPERLPVYVLLVRGVARGLGPDLDHWCPMLVWRRDMEAEGSRRR